MSRLPDIPARPQAAGCLDPRRGNSAVIAAARGSCVDHSSGEPSRTLCQHFTSISPDLSGHRCQTDRAPMLVGAPLPVILSVFRALGPALWIGRDERVPIAPDG